MTLYHTIVELTALYNNGYSVGHSETILLVRLMLATLPNNEVGLLYCLNTERRVTILLKILRDGILQ